MTSPPAALVWPLDESRGERQLTQAIEHWSTQEAVRRYLDGLNALDPDLAVSTICPERRYLL